MAVNEFDKPKSAMGLLFRHSEFGLAIGVVCILIVLIIPLPTAVLLLP